MNIPVNRFGVQAMMMAVAVALLGLSVIVTMNDEDHYLISAH
jgi:hypothetical protein